MRWLVVLLSICFVTAKADTTRVYNLEGTVGRQKIVMCIYSGPDLTWGRYFFKDNPVPVTCSGHTTANGFELWVTSYRPITDEPVRRITITIKRDSAENWSGTWSAHDPDSYPSDWLDVSLKPADFAGIKNPWENYLIMRTWLRLDSFERYRIACVHIDNDSVTTVSGCRLQKRHIRGTDIYSWFIVSGTGALARAVIDTDLTNELLETFQRKGREDHKGMYTTGIYLSKHVYSLRRVTYSSHNLSVPFVEYNPVTFDLRTGKKLKLEQVLHMNDIHEPYWTSDGMAPPCCKETAEALYRFFNNLYPSQMKQYYQECSCTTKYRGPADVWFNFFWFISEKGLYISPSPSIYHESFDPPNFSYIPFDTVKHYPGKVLLR